MQWHDVPAAPGRHDLDPLLAEATDRVVVRGTDGDLAAVVLRLLRKELLTRLTVGYVPVADSPVARLWGLEVGDVERALAAPPRPVPLLKDDSGGILLGEGVLEPITGQAYCDDERVLNGPATRVVVSPDPEAEALLDPTSDPLNHTIEPPMDGLRVTVTRRGLLRRREHVARGRAFQASFRTTTVRHDGTDHPRAVAKWVWYRHTEDLNLAR
ncbi:hypothetical protein EIL87_26645 [Saccharopolyspora rhizosphaerae]|uniref:Uncharacterized protein n=1 Tax=Saccharopolyspora rhizosphaerae TaxID=2492662 RepID=A0A3R8PYL3_9PSEU|nr:hypothetical protein [Saccharopolyspora rhizosphaerae]RRO13210.1 hypothetical protein EIL87_26645 [Saccharopolyspora rhizosphaerae]